MSVNQENSDHRMPTPSAHSNYREIQSSVDGSSIASTESLTDSLASDDPLTEATPLVGANSGAFETSERTGTIFSSIFTLVSTMIGGGLLSLPFAFQQGGFLVSSFILLFVLAASTYGGFLIINSKKYCQGKIRNIEDVARVAFGIRGQRTVQITLFFMLYLVAAVYFILIFDQIEPLLQYIAGGRGFWTRRIVILSMISILVFPISLLKNLSALQYTSSLSVLCGLLLCVCVAYRSIENHLGGHVSREDNPIKWHPNSLREFLTCISIAELTFSCHFNILPMHTELANQTRKNKRLILFIAMGVTYLMNFSASFFGYFQFRKFTSQDITRNYAHDDVVITAGRASLGFVLLLSFPLLIVPARQTLNKMIWSHERVHSWRLFGPSAFVTKVSNHRLNGPSALVWFLETFLIVYSAFGLAYVVPQINMLWGFVGAIGCTVIIYILPPAFYLKVRHHPEKPDAKKICAWLLLIVGIFLLCAGIYQSIMNIVDPIPDIEPFQNLRNNTFTP
eukprot:gene3441-3936_t